MATQEDHYRRLLARHYTWMVGVPFTDKVTEQASLLREMGVIDPGVAIDLGCGPGFQSIALADMGARHVHAIDTSEALLSELTRQAQGRPITPLIGDLRQFDALVREPADTIICMGDTLTHLRHQDDVIGLFETVATSLRPGGRLCLSWRDLSHSPDGLDRFIPVHGDDQRVMMCFLEDHGETVLVHDLVHVRADDGWTMHKSAYPKLKLAPAWLREALRAVDLTPGAERTMRGMTYLVARA